jgi:hypothetical protein
MKKKNSKYELALVITQTVYIDVEATSFDEAVKKAGEKFSDDPSEYVEENEMFVDEISLIKVD